MVWKLSTEEIFIFNLTVIAAWLLWTVLPRATQSTATMQQSQLDPCVSLVVTTQKMEQIMKTWFTIDGTLEPIDYDGPSYFRFPMELAEIVISRYSAPGDWVFDPFCGFGTTLVAAQKLDRQAIGFEKEIDHARFASSRVTPPNRVILDDIVHLSNYDLPQFNLLFTSPPYDTFRDWQTEGAAMYSNYMLDFHIIYSSIATVMQPSSKLILEMSNVRDPDRIRMIAWDATRVLSELFHFEGELVRCNSSKTCGVVWTPHLLFDLYGYC